MSRARRAVILPVVLVLVGLLALAMAGFMFFVRAEATGVYAQRELQQARLAAESGLEELGLLLREEPDNPARWWNVPDSFRNILVWSDAYTREDDPVAKLGGSREDLLAQGNLPLAWRYSIVAENLDGPPDTIRFGITPEAAKLNLNAASDPEIERLLAPLLLELQIENGGELIAALLDWLDEDDDPRPGGAENEYYNNLVPGYNTKNDRLDTLEELLMIRGFTPAVLYGEDVNRNGILDENENDGEASFPYYDNADGELNRGLAAYCTIWSRESRMQSGQGPGGGGGGGGANLPGDDSEGAAGGDADDESAGGDEDGKEPPNKARQRGQSQQVPGQQPPGQLPQLPGLGGQPGGQPGQGQVQLVEGLVNVNAAPLRVLQALDGMPPEIAEAIVTLRRELSGEALAAPDWLVTSGAMDAGTYAQLQDKLTTKAVQFHVEILGYGDHTRLARRYEWVIELRGKLVQVLYHRDLTSLGLAWPVDDDDYLLLNASGQ